MSLFKKMHTLPVLPLRDLVMFPGMVAPLFVGRLKSVEALQTVIEKDKQVILVTQKNPKNDDPTADDLYMVGTLGTILQLLKLPDGTVKVLVEGRARVAIEEYKKRDSHIEAKCKLMESGKTDPLDIKKLCQAVITQFESYTKLNKKIPPETIVALNQADDADKIADTIASHLTVKIEEKQKLLAVADIQKRLEMIFAFMEGEISVMNVEKEVRGRVKKQMESNQREYYLNEQMKAIKKELGKEKTPDSHPEGDELDELADKIEEANLPEDALKRAEKELDKLKKMPPMSAEATIVRNYLDWIVSLPWSVSSDVKKDMDAAEDILDEEHHGLEKVKDHILEYLAVQQRADKVKGPILCLVGPPGVGKTSLGKSIAKATNREYVRMSLGGVRDESEIRGHRRTYLGALPGKILQGMKKAGKTNPLFLLDEIDKLSNDWRGDPSSALLEVLDPEQNATFQDHYLEMDYDLSDVMFVCTANDISNMQRPLLDRMEIIRLSGYTIDEKVAIAKKHLIEKQMDATGLKDGEFKISDKALHDLILYYTREAGVRNLEREIAKLCRKAIKDIVTNKKEKIAITPKNLAKFSGVRKFSRRHADEDNAVGVVSGLSYSETGGSILSIEAVVMHGKDGKVSMTGNLKDVMKESVTVAEMLIKSRAPHFGIDYERLQDQQIHVHVPEGAVPKDGPSAGAAMVTTIVSALTGIPINNHIAMTGEVNLRGKVTEIGGLKEKLIGAILGGIKTVLIPESNVKDLEDIPDNVKKELEIIPVSTIDEVLFHALTDVPKPQKDDFDGEFPPFSQKTAENSENSVIEH